MVSKVSFVVVWSLLFGATVWALVQDDQTFQQGKPVAVLQAKRGDVQYRPVDLMLWNPVIKNQYFFEGDSLATGDNARARVDFVDGRSFTLDQNTQISINELKQDSERGSDFVTFLKDYGQEKKKAPDAVVTLVKGQVEAAKSNQKLELEALRAKQLARERQIALRSRQEERERLRREKLIKNLQVKLKKVAVPNAIESEARRLAEIEKKLRAEKDEKRRKQIEAKFKLAKKEQLQLLKTREKEKAERARLLRLLSLRDQERFSKKSIVLLDPVKPKAKKKKQKAKTFAAKSLSDDDFGLDKLSMREIKKAEIKDVRVKSGRKIVDLSQTPVTLSVADTPKKKTVQQVPEEFKPKTEAAFVPKIVDDRAELRNDSSRILNESGIFWTKQSFANAGEFTVDLQIEEKRSALLKIVSLKNRRLSHEVVTINRAGKVRVKIPVKKLSSRGYDGLYAGVVPEIRLKIRLGLRSSGKDKIVWKRQSVDLVLRSLDIRSQKSVLVFVDRSNSVGSKRNWFKTGRIDKPALMFHLASAFDILKLKELLVSAKGFSIKRTPMPKDNGVYATRRKSVVAKINSDDLQDIDQVKRALGADLVFRGDPKSYKKVANQLARQKSKHKDREIFVTDKGKVISVEREFINSFPETQEFIKENFKNGGSRKSLEFIDSQ